MSISLRSRPILSSDAALGAYHTSRMDEARLIRASQITLRREIFKHFPAGPERDKRLNWLAEAVATAGSKLVPSSGLGWRRHGIGSQNHAGQTDRATLRIGLGGNHAPQLSAPAGGHAARLPNLGAGTVCGLERISE